MFCPTAMGRRFWPLGISDLPQRRTQMHLVDFCDEVNITLGLEVNINQNISELFQKYVFKIEISQCVIFISI